MDICRKIGHNFRVKSKEGDWQKEKCLDCGHEQTFNFNGWTTDEAYGEAHRRDYIQPEQTELWNLAYPSRKVITDPNKKIEIEADLKEKMLKKRMPDVAQEYLRSFATNKDFLVILKWHLGYDKK